MEKSYDPKSFEDEIYKEWEDEGCFRAERDDKNFTHQSSSLFLALIVRRPLESAGLTIPSASMSSTILAARG